MEGTITQSADRHRMAELLQPIEQQISVCHTAQDKVMMACALLAAAKDLLDNTMGEEGRQHIFKGFTQ